MKTRGILLIVAIVLILLSQGTMLGAPSNAYSQAKPQSPDNLPLLAQGHAVSSTQYQPGAPLCEPVQTPNLVPNPSFEQGNGRPDHWWAGGPCLFSYDDPGPSSDVSAEISASSSRDRDCQMITYIEEIPIEPNRFYDYSMQVQADLVRGNAYLRVTFWSGQPGDWRYKGNAYTTPVTDTQGAWVLVTGSVQAPANAEYARMQATLPNSSVGSVWFDDVYFGLSTCLHIGKQDAPDPVAPGETLTYTIVYSNTGRETATDVQVIETYDPDVDVASTQPPPDRGNHTWEIPDLAPGASGTIVIVAQVEDDAQDRAWLTNAVEIDSDETQANPISAVITTTVFAALTGVDIQGPTTGVPNTPYSFVAATSPALATPPITYAWSPPPTQGQGTDSATYTWDTTGPKTITVAAANAGGAFTDTHTITIAPDDVALTDVVISGPTRGSANAAHTFTAVVNPIMATQPITYLWQATGQSPLVHLDGPSDTATFTWDTPGTKAITVRATNASGTVNDTHSIVIVIPVQDVNITGPTTGKINTPYTFTANPSPPTATLPITYTWSPAPVMGQGSDTAIYTWSTAGTKTIAVSATNSEVTAADTHSIAIRVPVEGVIIAGPTTGIANTDHTFAASAIPPTATLPLNYTWSPAPKAGQGSAIATYNWSVAGPQTITVVATNADGTFSDFHVITIMVPVQNVAISGPSSGFSGADYAFTAAVSPLTTTLPITYTWQATGQDDVVATTHALNHTVIFTWIASGPQTIIVTADNAWGTATASHSIFIKPSGQDDLRFIYLPLVMRYWSSIP